MRQRDSAEVRENPIPQEERLNCRAWWFAQGIPAPRNSFRVSSLTARLDLATKLHYDHSLELEATPVLSCDARYGAQRMWGAVGYGFAVLFSGIAYDNTGGGYGGVVVVFVVALAVALVAALRVPVGDDNDKQAGGERGGGIRSVKNLFGVEFLAGHAQPVFECAINRSAVAA